MASVTFRSATCYYEGADRPAVDGLDLEIEDGELLVLVGPSGCGKSTSLRMLAGLEPVSSGSIWIDEDDVTRASPKDRDIAMVFQNYALYPHMTVAENMAFSLRMAKVDKAEQHARVAEAARLLDLEDLLDRRPKALSGGQRQRVAMGRAIVRQPKVFCMDEPLSNLDAKLRVSTRTQISALQRRLRTTTVYVTHDQVEAMTMGDRVAVMRDGVLQQVDTPLALYDRPANLFVAGFVGSPAMNFLPTTSADTGLQVGGQRLPAPPGVLADSRAGVVTGVRPEGWSISTSPRDGGLRLIVDVVEELGADAYIYGSVDLGAEQVQVAVRTEGRGGVTKQSEIYVVPRTEDIHYFDAGSGDRLSG